MAKGCIFKNGQRTGISKQNWDISTRRTLEEEDTELTNISYHVLVVGTLIFDLIWESSQNIRECLSLFRSKGHRLRKCI